MFWNVRTMPSRAILCGRQPSIRTFRNQISPESIGMKPHALGESRRISVVPTIKPGFAYLRLLNGLQTRP